MAATTTTFLLLRHAEHALLGRTLAGRMPGVGLSPAGHAQAARLAENVAREFAPLAAVGTGPLERARQTAAPLAARCGLPAEVSPALDEVDYGAWTGRPFTDLEADPAWQRWNHRRATAGVPDGENVAAVRARVVAGLDRWRRAHPGGTVALFSHCETIRVLLLDVLGLGQDEFWRLEVGPASLSVVTVDGDDTRRVLRVNDTAARRG